MRKKLCDILDELQFGKLDRRDFLKMAANGTFLVGSSAFLSGCNLQDLPSQTTEADQPNNITDERESPKNTFYFAVISDTHITKNNSGQNKIMAQTMDALNRHDPPLDFVIITGDCVESLPSSTYEYYFNHVTELDHLNDFRDTLTMPLYPCMGNHDYYTGATFIKTPKPLVREEVYLDKLDMPGPYYAFEHKGVKFCCLNTMQNDNNVDWAPDLVGSYGTQQISWLKEELADGKPAFFFQHHPLATRQSVNIGYSGLAQIPFEVPFSQAGFAKYENWDNFYSVFGMLLKAFGIGDYDYTDPMYQILQDNRAQIKAVFFGHTHLFMRDACLGVPVFMTDAMKSPRFFLYNQGDSMRYHIVECEADTGAFRIYNQDAITYADELGIYSAYSGASQTQGMDEFLDFCATKGLKSTILNNL